MNYDTTRVYPRDILKKCLLGATNKMEGKRMEQREVEQELSSLMEITLRLEDELNYLIINQN